MRKTEELERLQWERTQSLIFQILTQRSVRNNAMNSRLTLAMGVIEAIEEAGELKALGRLRGRRH